MPVGKVICKCKKCNATFEKRKDCKKRSEADAWEKWAVDTIDLCPDCYKEQKKRTEPLHYHLIPATTGLVHISLSGNMTPYKEDIKATGYKWEMVEWIKAVTLEELKDNLKKLREIMPGIKCGTPLDDIRIQRIKKEREEFLSEQRRKVYEKVIKQRMIADLSLDSKPAVPEVITDKKWNKKIYGRKGYYIIYLDGEKVNISDGEKESLEQYITDREKYNEVLKDYKSIAITKDFINQYKKEGDEELYGI